MRTTITPGSIKGSIAAPSSKSMTQRAYAAALLHNGNTTIYNAGTSDDEQAALSAIRALGANVINLQGGAVHVASRGVIVAGQNVDCHESGLAARLFTPIAALAGTPVTITGSGSLLTRPMLGFEQALKALGVTVETFNGHLPATVMGPIIPASVSVNGADGSQLISGLLLALSNAATAPITLTVSNLKSRPYIDLTLDVLNRFGKPISHKDYREFYFDPSLFSIPSNVTLYVEGDWSGAANMLVAGAIAGDVTVANLNNSSLQADKAILIALKHAGASLHVQEDSVEIQRSKLTAFEFDATHCPDLFPALAILAACCEGESYIKGIHRLFNKESNRTESISEMLQNFDVPFSIEDDSLCIVGVHKLQGTIIDSYNDHRIAMAAAIGALRANGPVDILNAGSVAKSYPAFFNDLSLCGVAVQSSEQ